MLGGYVVVAVTVVLVVVVCCGDVIWPKNDNIYIYIHCPIFPLIASHCVIAFVGSKDGFGVGLCDGLVG